MANVIMAANPKRIRVFINSNGTITEGGITEAFERNKTGLNLGSNGGANKLPETDRENKE